MHAITTVLNKIYMSSKLSKILITLGKTHTACYKVMYNLIMHRKYSITLQVVFRYTGDEGCSKKLPLGGNVSLLLSLC